MRHQVRNPSAALSGLFELPWRAEHLHRLLAEGIHEGEALSLDERGRNRLSVELLKFWLIVEQVELARTTSHEQVDDILHLRRKVSRSRLHGMARLLRRGESTAA